MTTTELKARAYDIVAQIQFLQSELAKINAELESRLKEEQASKDEE